MTGEGVLEERNHFTALNSGYVEELYERYLRDPASVDPATRRIFDRWTPARPVTGEQPPAQASGIPMEKAVQAVRYAHAIRTYGHLAARLYPLGQVPPGDPSLEITTHRLTEEDLRALPASLVGGPAAEDSSNALEAMDALKEIYTGTAGYDFGHIEDPREREWLRFAAERGRFRPPQEPVDPVALLDRLTQVEVFEDFLQRHFPGKTRFSIEGLDMLVPMLDEILDGAIDAGICMLMIGMAHRGRLNVLAHVLHKPYAQILAEFKEQRVIPTRQEEGGWSGDVKYHKGANRALPSEKEVQIIAWMPPNPSHLEHVNPVIEGLVRSAQSAVNRPGAPRLYPDAALPLLIHGDAAFPGEGIVAETLNFSKLPGYETAGTVHFIANNQLGFTAPPEQGRSTLYASDLAKGFKIPIIHVNADDPEACIEAARMAIAYREEFHKDFLVDLIGYRRYGHNEGDEPGFTQPVLYEEIRQHPSVRRLWAEKLGRAGQVSQEAPDELVERYRNELQQILEEQNLDQETEAPVAEETPDTLELSETSVSLNQLQEWNRALLQMPEGFTLNPKLQRGMQRRGSALDEPDKRAIEWAAAEELAFASILHDGTSIRFTGQDVERGTFSHRHAAFFDFKSGERYIPLQHLSDSDASFELTNSPLSENAAVGFEYGYSIFDPQRLVIWEAQYGDFINVAQTMIDEFVASGKAKWGLSPSLVLLLPHGYEGQGPDHSSGRIERFLTLAGGSNMRVANCTTAAQYFHLLRLQAVELTRFPRPLVVFTPKSLLRNPLVASSPNELSTGHWEPVLDDASLTIQPSQVKRLVLCSGKIAIDLLSSSKRAECQETAILRLEQLYPFPGDDLAGVLKRYKQAKELYWAQEEPENMGAWGFVEPRLRAMLGHIRSLNFIGRPASASPAEGSFGWHTSNQEALIAAAFGVDGAHEVEESRDRNGKQDRRSELGRVGH